VKRPVTALIAAAIVLSACGGGGNAAYEGGDQTPATAGQRVFATTCIACHGSAGEGVPGLGSDLTTSQLVRDLSDDELIVYLEVGRSADDPLNASGLVMPARGGNMTLTTADLANLVAYLRTINTGS
jgi:mono/diheme cytochrome c family protein